MTGGGDIPVPTPVEAHGLFFVTNADQTAPASVAWSQPRDGGYMQTPLAFSA